MISHRELLLTLERNLRRCANKNGNVKMKDIELAITHFITECTNAEKEDIPVKKFLFVEDGSVDSDELTERLADTNPEIKVVIYRQGSARPQLQEVDE